MNSWQPALSNAQCCMLDAIGGPDAGMVHPAPIAIAGARVPAKVSCDAAGHVEMPAAGLRACLGRHFLP